MSKNKSDIHINRVHSPEKCKNGNEKWHTELIGSKKHSHHHYVIIILVSAVISLIVGFYTATFIVHDDIKNIKIDITKLQDEMKLFNNEERKLGELINISNKFPTLFTKGNSLAQQQNM